MRSGDIYIHKASTLVPVKCLTLHSYSLFEVKFSPKANYFASSDYGGHVVVWLFPTFEQCIEWEDSRVCLIEWHPFKEKELLIGTTAPATLSLINLVSRKVVAYYQRFDEDCQLDAMTFNRISGELVVSFYIPNLGKINKFGKSRIY